MLPLTRYFADQASPLLTEWLQNCPDPNTLNDAILQFATQCQHDKWLSEQAKCSECGQVETRHEMRWDDSGLFGAETHLICRRCWDYTNGAAFGGLGPWPNELPSMHGKDERNVEELPILLDGQIIGHVENYSRKTHSGKVSLNAFPGNSECGLLMPEWTVPRPNVIEEEI